MDPRKPNNLRWWTSCGRSDKHRPHAICEHAGARDLLCQRCLRPIGKILACHGQPFQPNRRPNP